jgi:hypothetical protein
MVGWSGVGEGRFVFFFLIEKRAPGGHTRSESETSMWRSARGECTNSHSPGDWIVLQRREGRERRASDSFCGRSGVMEVEVKVGEACAMD